MSRLSVTASIKQSFIELLNRPIRVFVRAQRQLKWSILFTSRFNSP